MRRRTFLGAAAAGLAAGPLLSRTAFAAGATKLRVQLGWIANIEYADLWIALEQGLMGKAGLDVAPTPGGPNAPDPLKLVAGGSTDLGYTSWLPFLDAVKLGNDFVIIGAQFQSNPLGIISLAKKPIRKPADLVGAKILAQGANEQTAIEATLALNKLPNKWTMVPTGFSPEPLLNGDGEGYTAFATNQVITLEQMGLKNGTDFFFVSFDDLGFKSYSDILFTSRKFLEANRPALVSYIKALIQAEQINEKDVTVAAKLAVDKYGADLGLDLKQQTRENELQIPFIRPKGDASYPIYGIDLKTMSGPMYDAAKATGRTDLPDIGKIADPSLAADALKAALTS